MRESFIIGHLNNVYARIEQAESKLKTVLKVLEEIVGKELMRGQALHKVLMDKALVTDAELKTALEKIIEESKVELEKAKEAVKAEKQEKIELLIPAGANITPPVDTAPAPTTTPDAPATPPEGASGPV